MTKQIDTQITDAAGNSIAKDGIRALIALRIAHSISIISASIAIIAICALSINIGKII